MKFSAGTMDVSPARVPNVVHFVWLAFHGRTSNMSFIQYLSILSAHKFIRPCHIFFHSNKHPIGPYWDLAMKIPEFTFVYRPQATTLFGTPIKLDTHFPELATDLERLLVLKDYGGIYMDSDVIALKSFTDLLQYDMTLGKENDWKICAGLIISHSISEFLHLWLRSYFDDARPDKYAYNSGTVSGVMQGSV